MLEIPDQEKTWKYEKKFNYTKARIINNNLKAHLYEKRALSKQKENEQSRKSTRTRISIKRRTLNFAV